MREVHCNLQIIRAYEVPDNLKVGFRLPYDTTKDLAEIFWVSQSLHSWGMDNSNPFDNLIVSGNIAFLNLLS